MELSCLCPAYCHDFPRKKHMALCRLCGIPISPGRDMGILFFVVLVCLPIHYMLYELGSVVLHIQSRPADTFGF
ncbi:hypothetical protein F4811DRAFT_538062 [Daldinia bambusicola]|nr:hypothetical protein F4811DRAFT_538062 [Daldinia bambusicola]